MRRTEIVLSRHEKSCQSMLPIGPYLDPETDVLRAMASRFEASSFRLDHSFRGGEFFKGGRLPQAHGPAARARQIVAVGRKGDARNGSVMPVQRRRFLHGNEVPQL